MHKILENIFETRKFKNSKNEIIEIHSETGREQCLFLQDLVKKNKFKKSLEVGFAYGTSTVAITEAVVENDGRHLVIDKFQNNGWSGNGLDLVNQAGLSDKIDFFEEFCYDILPSLFKEGRIFDFVYIDSTKQFDWLLVNFFYVDKMLEINGIIVFDDGTFPGIRKLLRYISQFPNYKVHSHFPAHYESPKSRKVELLKKLLGQPENILKEEIMNTDFDLGVNSPVIALQKIDSDKRNWDWHVNF
jgi:predicted O-methyltransferase YrrM